MIAHEKGIAYRDLKQTNITTYRLLIWRFASASASQGVSLS